ncbi:glycosyltransferase family protein [Paenibacillus sp. GCM10027627]|uniref:glycosyltransferase family protein n=1 Tax=unclassified Paenibacillus TaxID=185978 RepID=UPI00363E5D59
MTVRKIIFIMCVNDSSLRKQAKRQIASLAVPSGYSVEICEIENANGMASGYNKSIELEAAYKVYLHQDTFLIYSNVLLEMIELFERHPSVGMIGLAGCVKMPESGVWWEGEGLVGQVIEHRRDTFSLLRFPKGWHESDDLVAVEAIDGLFMATKIDIPWREDLFDGFHFYDTSHSFEMRQAGYGVAVPVTRSPWCIHYNGDDFDALSYEKYRRRFVQHYNKEG